MPELLLGRSGSGKTAWIRQRLATLSRAGRNDLYLLVPEQYSFESERALLAALGPMDAARVQVLSFTRLADTVFREVGGLAGQTADDGTRALLMSRALEMIAAVAADQGETLLGADARRVADAGYTEQLLSLRDELCQCAVPAGELERIAREIGDPDDLLAHKTEDLYRIFTAYEGLLAARGLREADRLDDLADKLPDSRLPDGAAVFVDGFKGFTAQEERVLERLMPRVSEMTVALGTDTPGAAIDAACDRRREYALFSPVTDTARRLCRAAERHGLAFTVRMLEDNRRTDSAALQALERELYAPMPVPYEGAADEVAVVPCADVYEECQYVARRVRHLLRTEGMRCRDITLVARDAGRYAGIIEEALEREGVPCRADDRQEILCEPLMTYAAAALRLAVGGLRTEGILRLLKTDLTPLDEVEIATLENYVYMWRVDGSGWERPFTENPEGLDCPVTADTAARLAQLNGWRERIVTPLLSLRARLRGNVSGREFAVAMYDYLTHDPSLPERAAAHAARLAELAQPVLAQQTARLWDELMAILDRFVLALADDRMPAARLEELFLMLARMTDMGTIPQGLDAVTFGSADRIRYASPRAVFVLGANEGVFPAYPAGDGLLTEEERRRMSRQGLELSGDLLRRCVEERYFAYMALSAPRERLCVTYISDGEATPSPLIEMIDRILPHHGRDTAVHPSGDDLESPEDVLSRLAGDWQSRDGVTAGLRGLIAERPAFAGRLAAVERSAGERSFRLEQPDNAREMFGTDMRLSVSQAEKFYQCRFAYFCRYGVDLRPRKKAQVDAALFGTMVHAVMEELLPRYNEDGGLAEELRRQDAAVSGESDDIRAAAENRLQAMLMPRLERDVAAVVERYVARTMGGTAEKSGSFRFQLEQAARAARNILWHTLMELRQSEFRPVDYELTIRPGEDGEPLPEDAVLSLRLPFDGGSLRISGKVDRVDLYIRGDGTAFVRVVDYKTGSTRFDISALAMGQKMQMLVYLFILCDNSRRYLPEGGSLRPAGVLYHPLSDLVTERGSKASRERLRGMCMSGLVLNDAGVVQAMEPGGDRAFIPAALDKGGEPKGAVATARQFALLRGVVEDLLRDMATTLLSGGIEAVPLKNGERVSCEYCDYRAVCGRDKDAPVRETVKRTLEQVTGEAEETPPHTECGEAAPGKGNDL